MTKLNCEKTKKRSFRFKDSKPNKTEEASYYFTNILSSINIIIPLMSLRNDPKKIGLSCFCNSKTKYVEICK